MTREDDPGKSLVGDDPAKSPAGDEPNDDADDAMSALLKTLFGDAGSVAVVVIVMAAEVLSVATGQVASAALPRRPSCQPALRGSPSSERI